MVKGQARLFYVHADPASSIQ